MPTKPARQKLPRFGIAEWYGKLITAMSSEERLAMAERQLLPMKKRTPIDCPFKGGKCSKESGICSIRLYQVQPDGTIAVVTGETGELRALCPSRFHEDLKVFHWAGEEILGDPDPIRVPEVGFLESTETTDSKGGEDVGRIDMVLVKHAPGDSSHPLEWCALEIQAVYFSGEKMRLEFEAIVDAKGDLVFPVKSRRPDYRSSAPKRLMPQLQIKVPELRRWGKKMAVVVDRPFFKSMGEVRTVPNQSNGDVVWIVVRFEEDLESGRAILVQDQVRISKLEDAVEGLTGGIAVPRSDFEARIIDKINGGKKKKKSKGKKA